MAYLNFGKSGVVSVEMYVEQRMEMTVEYNVACEVIYPDKHVGWTCVLYLLLPIYKYLFIYFHHTNHTVILNIKRWGVLHLFKQTNQWKVPQRVIQYPLSLMYTTSYACLFCKYVKKLYN